MKPPLLKYYSLASSQVESGSAELDFELLPGVKMPYFRKVVHMDTGSTTVTSIDSFSHSGVLLGRALNLGFEEVQGIRVPVNVKIFDVKNPRIFANQHNSSVKVTELPQAFFTPGFLHEVEGYFERRLSMN